MNSDIYLRLAVRVCRTWGIELTDKLGHIEHRTSRNLTVSLSTTAGCHVLCRRWSSHVNSLWEPLWKSQFNRTRVPIIGQLTCLQYSEEWAAVTVPPLIPRSEKDSQTPGSGRRCRPQGGRRVEQIEGLGRRTFKRRYLDWIFIWDHGQMQIRAKLCCTASTELM